MAEGDEDDGDSAAAMELPESVIDEAERLARLARGAVDADEAAAYRDGRDEVLDEHGYTARVREEDASDDAVLVCYPDEWVEDGTVQIDRIEDVDRGIERSLEGPGDGDWDAVATTNDAVVERVEREHGEPHVATARALADFASNHYAKPIADLTPGERREFRDDYFRRNAWPSERQFEAVDDSLELIFEEMESVPGDPP